MIDLCPEPCPFCGSDACYPVHDPVDHVGYWHVYCPDCETEGPCAKGKETNTLSRLASVSLWNGRADWRAR